MTITHLHLLMEKFETCTLPKEEWTHANHFVMALWYCTRLPIPQAIEKIRGGIKKYNESIGGKNTADAGYHETITLFYTRTIADYLLTAHIHTLTDETLHTFLQQAFLKKDYILRFYSRDLLMSKDARLYWKAPDKATMYSV
ncbi:hypothetical protein [Chitinophaga pinensis]|uniref:Uncharacterized protein n=1 Tax=Chitinophaga pinensis (strain ATCC 43595 / DSM 2588 / LMG 13176 / NBRC 15968 / NCIMB 11800 / UQM 2034) TaxID=485918 RepID=A0A979GTT1_CHIPD|nr:hypothetical protein [Chitinophaga pinensis]ACU60304.1 conserved hypothetical protein [Chitinophaga pinensis DSM 2588]